MEAVNNAVVSRRRPKDQNNKGVKTNGFNDKRNTGDKYEKKEKNDKDGKGENGKEKEKDEKGKKKEDKNSGENGGKKDEDHEYGGNAEDDESIYEYQPKPWLKYDMYDGYGEE